MSWTAPLTCRRRRSPASLFRRLGVGFTPIPISRRSGDRHSRQTRNGKSETQLTVVMLRYVKSRLAKECITAPFARFATRWSSAAIAPFRRVALIVAHSSEPRSAFHAPQPQSANRRRVRAFRTVDVRMRHHAAADLRHASPGSRVPAGGQLARRDAANQLVAPRSRFLRHCVVNQSRSLAKRRKRRPAIEAGIRRWPNR